MINCLRILLTDNRQRRFIASGMSPCPLPTTEKDGKECADEKRNVQGSSSFHECHDGVEPRPCAAGRPKTASHRDSGGAAKARFYTPRSLRKRPSCLKSEARFPVGAVWHPAFAQVGGPPVRPRDFRAGKIKHEGRSRSERGVQNAVSTRGGGHVCLGAVFGQPPGPRPAPRTATHEASERSERGAACEPGVGRGVNSNDTAGCSHPTPRPSRKWRLRRRA